MYKLRIKDEAKIESEDHFMIYLKSKDCVEKDKSFNIFTSDVKEVVEFLNIYFNKQQYYSQLKNPSKNYYREEFKLKGDQVEIGFEFDETSKIEDKEIPLDTKFKKESAISELQRNLLNGRLDFLEAFLKSSFQGLDRSEKELRRLFKSYLQTSNEKIYTEIEENLLRVGFINNSTGYQSSFEKFPECYMKKALDFLKMLPDFKIAYKKEDKEIEEKVLNGEINSISRKYKVVEKKLKAFDLESVEFRDKYGRRFEVEIKTLADHIRAF